MGETKTKDGKTFTIKCSLGRLKPSLDLRSAIENTVEKIHAIALRGSFVATEAWLASTSTGDGDDGANESVPKIDQTWWFRCFATTYSSKRNSKGVGDATIDRAYEKLFPSAVVERINGDYMWSFTAELARDAMTMTHNMIAATFHKQILKAIRREIVLYEARTNHRLEKRIKYQIASHYSDRAVGHRRATATASATLEAEATFRESHDLPEGLRTALDSLLTNWSDLLQRIGPCPTSEFIYNDHKRLHLAALMTWMTRLQKHRQKCIEEMESITGSQEEARRRLGRTVRAQAPLPFFSWQIKHIPLTNTSLKALAQMAGLCGSKDKPTFEEYFPGLIRFGGNRSFQNYIRTDGVSASLVMMNNMKLSSGKKPRKQKRKQQ